MKVHLVFAHPSLQSFNGQLRNTALHTLESLGCSVTVSDLYQIKFKAAADQDDFISAYNADFFDLQIEQEAALKRHSFAPDILREHQLLGDADLIILQFPLWWYSMPALLKGYIDRVFSMGWAYGGGQALTGKKVLVSFTTGAPEFAWTPEKKGTITEILKHLFVGTFALCGLENLEPFVVYGAKRLTDSDRNESHARLKTRLQELVSSYSNEKPTTH